MTGLSLVRLSMPLMVFAASFGFEAFAKTLELKSLAFNKTVLENTLSKKPTNFHIIQMEKDITAKHRAIVENQGAVFQSFIPKDAMLVKADKATIQKIKSVLGHEIHLTVPYFGALKLSSDIRSSIFNKDELLSVVIRTTAATETSSVLEELYSIRNLRVEDAGQRLIYAVTDYKTLDQVADIDGIEWIEQMPEFESAYIDLASRKEGMDPVVDAAGDYTNLTGYESGTKIMNFEAAYNLGYTGAGQTVAMADTGLDSGSVSSIHQDFANVTHGYAEGLFSKSWNDPQGHGTHVAGSVMGSGLASGGAFAGGAHGANMIGQGMWSPIMNNLMVPPQIGAMILKTYKDGARIHTNSWGSPRDLGSYSSFSAQVDEFMWNNPKMLVIFAAGNSGQDLDKNGIIDEDSVASPGTAKNVLTVGASENLLATGGIQKEVSKLRNGTDKWGAEPIASDKLSDNPVGIAAFSSRGPTDDGRIKPDVVAPGTNIVSVRSGVQGASALWGAYNDDYAYAGGTSMATPLTAGAAAVAREYLVKNRNLNDPSAALLKAVIMGTSTDLYPGQFGFGPKQELSTVRPNVHQGYGRVNVENVVTLKTDAIIADEELGLAEGETKSFTFNHDGSSKITAIMTYTDAPATASAATALVNNLDIEILRGSTVVARKNSSVDNVEMIEMALEAGTYTIVVKATRVINGKNGKQGYALFVK
ncbi:MAG: S8 family serine peptidase [Bdellovibrionales bacterium]